MRVAPGAVKVAADTRRAVPALAPSAIAKAAMFRNAASCGASFSARWVVARTHRRSATGGLVFLERLQAPLRSDRRTPRCFPPDPVSSAGAAREPYFSTRRKGGCRRFGLGAGGARRIPASSKSSRTWSLIKSRTLAEAISLASNSTGCGLDHFRCS